MTSPEEKSIKEMILTAVADCTVCGQQYTLNDLDIVGHRGELWFLTVACDKCNSRGLIAAFVTGEEGATLVSDFSAEETKRFDCSPGISSDDVLDVHEFLRAFDGDFAGLFGEKLK